MLLGSYSAWEVLYYLKLDCGKLKMYTINSKSITETTIWSIISSNPSKEMF